MADLWKMKAGGLIRFPVLFGAKVSSFLNTFPATLSVTLNSTPNRKLQKRLVYACVSVCLCALRSKVRAVCGGVCLVLDLVKTWNKSLFFLFQTERKDIFILIKAFFTSLCFKLLYIFIFPIKGFSSSEWRV